MSIQLDQRTLLTQPERFYAAYTKKLNVSITFPPDSDVTDQSFKEECDINTIMQRYQSTGELPVLNGQQGQWLDVTGMDFQRHMDFIIDAQNLFDQLPSAVRDRFGNDPAAFLDFTSRDENAVEIAKMGLLTEDATERLLRPKPVPPVAPAPAGE